MTRILIEGDLHCGNELGLTPPEFWRDDLREIQRVMWEFREEQIKSIGKVDIHILNGDLVDGPGKKDSQGHLTTDLKLQAEMAYMCALRVKAKRRYITRGTGYHVNNGLNVEDIVADELGCEIQDTLRIEVNGRRINSRHVVGRSDTPYGQATQIQKELARDLIQAAVDGHQIADLHIRSHVHYHVLVKLKGRQAFSMPCWELPIEHPGAIYPRHLRTMYYDVGFVLVEIHDSGEIVVRDRILPIQDHFPKEYTPWNASASSLASNQ